MAHGPTSNDPSDKAPAEGYVAHPTPGAPLRKPEAQVLQLVYGELEDVTAELGALSSVCLSAARTAQATETSQQHRPEMECKHLLARLQKVNWLLEWLETYMQEAQKQEIEIMEECQYYEGFRFSCVILAAGLKSILIYTKDYSSGESAESLWRAA